MDNLKIETILNTKTNEHDVLFNQLTSIDHKKITMMKIAFISFSIITSGFIAGFATIDKLEIAMSKIEYVSILTAIFIGIGMLNLSIIKYIIAYKHQRIFISRQLNCVRHAIDSCIYYLFENKFPENHIDLLSNKTNYYKSIGKHRKLPIINKQMRHYHRKIFESADNFLMYIITLMTVIITMTPILYLVVKFDTYLVAFPAGIFLTIFLSVVVWIIRQEKKQLHEVLYTNKDEISSYESNKHST